jgi:DNA-binding GntR family transcriptional regulator
MKPIASTPNRAEQVYVSIRDSICEGTLTAGTHLIQESLAARLGVSRQPIQQALVLLKNDGLVLERGSRGLYVAPLDAAATVDRYQIRLGLDQLAAQLCAEQAAASPEYAAGLRAGGKRILDRGDQASADGRYREAVSLDVEFHFFFYEMSGNPLIAITSDPLWHYLRRVMITVLSYAGRGPIVWEQHHRILETVAAGDMEQAVQLVTDHIKGAESALLGAIGNMPSQIDD